MKLFTSLTAGAAFAQAQDFPGFGGSLADLLAQLNIENQLDLGIGEAGVAGAEANVNSTEGEFDPITGERYLIANTGPDPNTPFENNCTGDVTNDAKVDCDPCQFDPSVCNGSQAACVSTKLADDGVTLIPLGIDENDPNDDNDDTWMYNCECDKHEDSDHNDGTTSGDGWAGPECLCTACGQWDNTHSEPNMPAACQTALGEDPCSAAVNAGDSNYDNVVTPVGQADTCALEPNNDEGYQCNCNAGFHGHDCSNEKPCAAEDDTPSDVCNDANGTNDFLNTDDETCTCDCLTQSQNEAGGSRNIMNGPNCDQTICEFAPRPGNCGSNGTPTNSHSTNDPNISAECTCTCDPNYSGDDCEIYACASTTCNNGGTVDDSVEGQCTCVCPAGFTGDQCETPLNTPTGTGCWKCDAMTYVQCATEGSFQTCSEDNTRGDNGVCFVEYREQNQKLTQLCTGCKDAKSCENLKRQNFVPGFEAGNTAPFMRMRNQCKPDYRLQVARRRYGNTQSVCRQCFSMCSNADAESAKTCFGGLGNSLVFTAAASNDDKIGAAQWIRYYKDIVGGPLTSSSPWNGGVGGTTDKLLRLGDINNNEAIVLGIPLHLTADNANSQTVVNSPLNHVFRGYTKSALQTLISSQNGNSGEVDGDSSDTTNPLYWTLADSTDFFWQNDLIQEQGVYEAAAPGADAFDLAGYDINNPCELDYGAGNYCDRS